MKTKILIVTTALMLCSAGCNNKNKAAEQKATETQETQNAAETQAIKDSIALETSLDSLMQEYEGKESLNDIRFKNWTQADWYDNDYYRYLRQTFNNYLTGKKTEIDESLKPYKSLLHGKFVILDMQPYINGGIFINLLFIDAPDRIFQTNIYSYVKGETITNYEVRGFSLFADETELTKEDILEIIKEHPENKLW
jgi:hypothetical protein